MYSTFVFNGSSLSFLNSCTEFFNEGIVEVLSNKAALLAVRNVLIKDGDKVPGIEVGNAGEANKQVNEQYPLQQIGDIQSCNPGCSGDKQHCYCVCKMLQGHKTRIFQNSPYSVVKLCQQRKGVEAVG